MENASCKIEPLDENPIKSEQQQTEPNTVKAIEKTQQEKNKIAHNFPENLLADSNGIINCFPSINDMIFLQNNEAKNGEKKFKCSFPNCAAEFAQSSNLKRHFRIHTSEKPYVCPTCNRAFNTSSNLKQHLQIHLTKEQRKKFICEICNKQYYYASNLKMHRQVYHSKCNKNTTIIQKLFDQFKSINSFQIQQQPSQPSTNSSQIYIKHNDHIDLLINGYLYFYDGNTIYVHQLEITPENNYDEYGCNPVCELSHYQSLQELSNIYKAIEKTLDYKISYNQLMNQNNCNAFICTCKLMKDHPNGENCVNNLIKSNQQLQQEQSDEQKQQSTKKGLCFCNETKQFIHKHSDHCGHIPIMHAGHIDYIVNGQLHFPHFDHCDNHGKIEVITEEELRNYQNSNFMLYQQLLQFYSFSSNQMQQQESEENALS